jgi:2-phosphosulfolactate phosphatase
MPAPDLPPPVPHDEPQRPLAVHLLPRLVDAAALAGGVVVMIDALRASTTIAWALEHGAARVVPTLTVDDARSRAERFGAAGERVVLGGERGGERIEGFDLGNSPGDYTRQRVGGATVVFTTTNGTAALLHAARAERVLVGSLCNLGAVCDAVAGEARPVHLLCAGTRDEVTLDDCLPAGAMVERLLSAGRGLVADDSALLCLRAWREAASRGDEGVREAMRAGRGGRNLLRLGMDADVDACAHVDSVRCVPEFVAVRGEIVTLRA